MTNMYLIDHLDRKFTPNEESRSLFGGHCGPFQFAFDVAAGIPEQHMICYEVPKDSENLQLHVQDWDYEFHDSCGYRFGVEYACNTYPPISLVPEKQIFNISTQATSQEPAQQTGGGCGAGTILVDGVCQLTFDDQIEADPVVSALAAATIGIILFFVLVGIGIIVLIIIIIVILIRRGKKTPKPAKQELDDYEEKYLAKQKPSRKPAEKKETSMFCDNCGAAFKKPTAKFCGGCGTPRS